MTSNGGRPPGGPLAASDARLGAAQLRRRCDPTGLGFETTAELAPLAGRIGQDRAAAAIEFALNVRGRGYNVLVTGPPGTGRRTTIQALLSEHAAERPAPSDWVYLFNFAEPVRPIAIALPGGHARGLAAAMERFVETAGKEIPRAFESDSYRERREDAVADLERRRQEGLARVREDASRRSIAVDIEVPWSAEHVGEYAGLVTSRVRERDLRHFDAGAVACVVEHGARVAGDQRKLTTRFAGIAEVVDEAGHWAAAAGRDLVTRADVQEAIERRIHRSNLLEERIDDLIADGTLMIAVDSERVGQVNGLSVVELGDYAFGRPVRITATSAAGRRDLWRRAALSPPVLGPCL